MQRSCCAPALATPVHGRAGRPGSPQAQEETLPAAVARVKSGCVTPRSSSRHAVRHAGNRVRRAGVTAARRPDRARSCRRRTDASCRTWSAPACAVLLCGINPSLWSGAVGLHFATPGNRLWPVLHGAGWTPRRLHPRGDRRRARAPGSASRTWWRGPPPGPTSSPTTSCARGCRRVAALAAALAAGAGWPSSGMTAYRTATGRRNARGRAAGASRSGGVPGVAAAQPQRPQRLVAAAAAGRGVRRAARRGSAEARTAARTAPMTSTHEQRR